MELRCVRSVAVFFEKLVSTRGRRYLYYMCGKNKKGMGCSTHKIGVEELDKKILEERRKKIGDIEGLCCRDLTKEIAIRYLKYVSVDCVGNIEVVWNT